MIVVTDLEFDRNQVLECVGEAIRRQFVPNLTAFSFGAHQTAPTQTAEMVRQVRLSGIDLRKQFARVARAGNESQKNLTPNRVRKGRTEPFEGVKTW